MEARTPPSLQALEARAKNRLCPSVQCSTDAHLIGVVGPDGMVGYLKPALPVSQAFVDAAEAQGRPTSRFRFTGPCLQTGCHNWRENRCQIIETELMARNAGDAVKATSLGTLPLCSIRAHCVWFAQRKRAACDVCPRVITDV